MNYPTITFTPSSEDERFGKLIIPGECSLEELYQNPHCPLIVKETLEKHISWQVRVETPVHLALGLKNQYLQFRAAMALFGVEDIVEGEAVEFSVEEANFGSSMIRPTPAHTPIVASFAKLTIENEVIKACSLALTGLEKRRISLPDTSEATGKPLTADSIQSIAQKISAQYEGFSDFNGTAEYRRSMAVVTLERALNQCAMEVSHE
jgi:hypothetical protein